MYDEDPATAYLVHVWMRKLVGECEELARVEDTFYIKHPDDKGDQFLTDEYDQIVNVLDWQW